MRWPKYATSIVIKYFISRKDLTETYVTVTFAGEVSDLFHTATSNLLFLLATTVTQLS